MKFKKKIRIAIDSPAAAGAGTQARLISKHYNLFFLDTGKIYRLLARNLMQKKPKNKIKYLTLYAFSTENWKRPKKEINFLFNLLENFLLSKISEFNKQNIKLKITFSITFFFLTYDKFLFSGYQEYLLFSLIIIIFNFLDKINLTLKQLTKFNANLVIKLISQYYKKKIKLKSPNDIFVNKKKICGILQETIRKNNIQYLIVGIGLNLVSSPQINKYPTTSLYDLTNSKISVNKISKELKDMYKNFLKSQMSFQ